MKNIRNDIENVLFETKRFYETDKVGAALINVKSVGDIKLPSLSLTDYDFPKDTHRYLDDRIARTMLYWNARLFVNDHAVPSVGPWYGIAEHSAFLGGDVEYGEDTSWQHMVIPDIDDLSPLSMSEENDIYKMVVGGIEYLREKCSDLLAPMVRGTSGVLEIANTLRTNDFFYDFYENPEELKALLAYCEKAIVWYYDKQLKAAGDFGGGVVTGFGEWLPGRSIGHMSEDTTTMISLETYEEFGRPHTENITKKYDMAFMHTHAMSERCLESIGNIENIVAMEISSDPNTDRAIEVYKRNKDIIKPVPVLNLTRDEIMNNLELLKSQKTIIWYEATCLEDAKDISDFVRTELPVR